MQKKIYIKDLNIYEITERLDKGQKLYVEGTNCYYQKIKNTIVRFINGTPDCVGISFEIGERAVIKYFLDDIKEFNVDKSYIGKLCKFWGEDEIDYDVAILKEIKNKEYLGNDRWYNYCSPLTNEEIQEFIKE